MKRQFLESLAVLSLSLLVLAHPDLTQTFAAYLTVSLQGISINLPVNPIKQSKATSCGEAVIAMAYNCTLESLLSLLALSGTWYIWEYITSISESTGQKSWMVA